MQSMEAEARKQHEAISAAMTGGKSFADAAKELNLEPTIHKDVTGAGRLGGVSREYEKASLVNPGSLSELITDDNEAFGPARSFFFFVDKREVYEKPNLNSEIDRRLELTAMQARRSAVANWFAQQRASADFQIHGDR